jgi:hypothetical protein
MSTINYTDVGRVVRALAFQSPELVAGDGSLVVGSTQISLNQTVPADWQVGTSLGIDMNNQDLFEVVQITSIPSNSQIIVTPLTQNHASGTPIVNVTAVIPYVSAASRWFDSVTYYEAGFGYEPITDKKTAYIDNEGFIVVPLSKPIVKIENVTSITFQSSPLDQADTLDLSKAWIEDRYFLKIATMKPYYRKNGMTNVQYSGGFNPVPDDIVQAVTVMAARMYKERDSGYSDVIGSAETGLVKYKKAAPADVQVIINKYRRWTE